MLELVLGCLVPALEPAGEDETEGEVSIAGATTAMVGAEEVDGAVADAEAEERAETAETATAGVVEDSLTVMKVGNGTETTGVEGETAALTAAEGDALTTERKEKTNTCDLGSRP